ncbi:MAG TPA: 3'(2'),5'-bisphosphate nucleotidase CysQ [Thermomicrobiales bacterium]
MSGSNHGRFEREWAVATAAAREAGAAIRDLYERAAAATYAKADGSAVTDADLAADRIIREALTTAFPEDAILTEEGADDTERVANPRCWIVDPIDGTNQFIERTGEFEVLIALVEDGQPVVAAVYQPTTDLLLTAVRGAGAWLERGGQRERLRLPAAPADRAPRLMTSVWMGAPANLPILEQVAGRLGGNGVTVSPLGVTVRRFLPPDPKTDALIGFNDRPGVVIAWEWDFAASELIMCEAGGAASDLWGRPHRYNKPVPRNCGGILLSVDPATHERVLRALAPELPAPPPDDCSA